MKIRSGFVSNSSSSSFVFSLPEKIETKKQLASYFSNMSKHEKYDKEDIISSLFVSINQISTDELLAWLAEYETDRLWWKAYCANQTNDTIEYDSFEEQGLIQAKKRLEGYIANPKRKFHYEVTYSDNKGSFYAMMEHDDIWQSCLEDVMCASHH